MSADPDPELEEQTPAHEARVDAVLRAVASGEFFKRGRTGSVRFWQLGSGAGLAGGIAAVFFKYGGTK